MAARSFFWASFPAAANWATAPVGVALEACFYLMRYGQLKNAMGWYLASDYFLNRLGEDETDVRWGIMDNDEYWRCV